MLKWAKVEQTVVLIESDPEPGGSPAFFLHPGLYALELVPNPVERGGEDWYAVVDTSAGRTVSEWEKLAMVTIVDDEGCDEAKRSRRCADKL